MAGPTLRPSIDPHDLVVCGIITLVLVAGAAASLSTNLATAPLEPSSLVVGYHGDLPPLDEIRAAGAIVVYTIPDLRAVVVETTDPLELSTQLTSLPSVRYADPNGLVYMDGASADGAAWDGAAWDGAAWDGAAWDGAAWDGAAWDGAAWDGSTAGHDQMDPGYPLQWGLGAINAPGAWDHTIGTGTVDICVVDSGIDYDHPDLRNQMWTGTVGEHGTDLVDGDNDPMDAGGHGTHVAGIAAATFGNAEGITGVANARLMAARVLDATGTGTEADVAAGLTWCTNNGARIAIMSLGTTENHNVLRDAVRYAKGNGVLVVASAGNSGCECTRYPAAYPEAVGVAAYKQGGVHASFSNTGEHIALAAPGYRIVSTLPEGQYVFGSGTSQAAPHVAGVAALVWSAKPGASVDEVRTILQSTAVDLGATGKDRQFGYGGVNAHGALHSAFGTLSHTH